MTDEELSRLLLRELLSSGEPEVGARLKQRLNAEFLRLGRGPFEHRTWGFARFSDYLAANSDLVRIIRPDGPGDIQVTLRAEAAGRKGPQGPPIGQRSPRQPRIRTDLWQAFTNPDPKRRRYYHMPSSSIRHFLQDESSPVRDAVERDPSSHVEIPFISGQQQLDWMRKYLDDIGLPDGDRAALGQMLEVEYTSRLNTAFAGALGDHALGWRRQRARLVYERVQQWRSQHQIPRAELEVVARPRFRDSARSRVRPPMSGGSTSARERVDALLSLLSDSDLDDVVLPLLLSAVWTRSRCDR